MQKLRLRELKRLKQVAKRRSNSCLSDWKVIKPKVSILVACFIYYICSQVFNIVAISVNAITEHLPHWELRTSFTFILIMKQSVESTEMFIIALIFEWSSKLWHSHLFRIWFVCCVCQDSWEERRNRCCEERAADSSLIGQEELMSSFGFGPATVQEASTCRQWARGWFIQAMNQDLKKSWKQDPWP